MAKNELTEMDVDLAPSLMKRGTNAAIVASVVATREIAKSADINDPQSLMDCLQKYLLFCMENNIKVTNMAAYAACGVSITDLSNWESGRTRKNDPRYKEFAQFVRSVCAQYREQAMSENILNPVVGIWWQKQYDGMRDNLPPADISDNGLEIKADPDEIAAKYKNVIDVEGE
jgi:hypothetical protein